jgi:hypothetical protein
MIFLGERLLKFLILASCCITCIPLKNPLFIYLFQTYGTERKPNHSNGKEGMVHSQQIHFFYTVRTEESKMV